MEFCGNIRSSYEIHIFSGVCRKVPGIGQESGPTKGIQGHATIPVHSYSSMALHHKCVRICTRLVHVRDAGCTRQRMHAETREPVHGRVAACLGAKGDLSPSFGIAVTALVRERIVRLLPQLGSRGGGVGGYVYMFPNDMLLPAIWEHVHIASHTPPISKNMKNATLHFALFRAGSVPTLVTCAARAV